MDAWFNRQLQNILLTILSGEPSHALSPSEIIASYLMNELPITEAEPNGYLVKDEYKDIALKLGLPLQITEELPKDGVIYNAYPKYHFNYSECHSQKYQDEFDFWCVAIRRNLMYLEGHDLVYENNTRHHFGFIISSKGVDFLIQDGGLSAILDVVTIKLHSETIQQLISTKIDASDLPPVEKSSLKSMLGTIKDSALSKITENAIDSVPAKTMVTFIKEALKASI